MAGLNHCQFIGRVGAKPEIHNTASASVANFSVAVSEKYTDKQGQAQETTEWVRCCAWGKLAEIADRFVDKGRLVYVGGKMTTRSWTNRDGAKQYSTQINVNVLQLLDRRDDGDRDSRGATYGNASAARRSGGDDYYHDQQTSSAASGWPSTVDEDLPF